MAKPNPIPKSNPSVDPKSGFCSQTKTFHSLRPPLPLPPQTLPLSASAFSFYLLHEFSLETAFSSPKTTALIDAATGIRLSYAEFEHQTLTLSANLQTLFGLSKGQTAFVISPTSLQIPILYFALLSLGVVISPVNPTSTESELSRQIQLSSPVIAFATSNTAHKVPSLRHVTVLLDSPTFLTMTRGTNRVRVEHSVSVSQSDPAAILYSSGTTGKVKGVVLTHRNLISEVAATYAQRLDRAAPAVVLFTVPLFHVYGFYYCMKSVAMSESVVLMERFEMKKMMRAVERFRVTHLALAPPVVVAMAKGGAAVDGFDLRSLEAVGSGGASLGKEVIEKFVEKYANVSLNQGYGMTETTGPSFRLVGPEECRHFGSVGRLVVNCEAKIVDPDTGNALPPCQRGELWVRGPIVMKGYIGDDEATYAALDSEGWLKTGDLCYIDGEGYLFIVDRLKELIKYKGYQVPPAELEHVLHSHPEIADAAVIPYPDEEAGQVPMAFVVRQPQSTIKGAEVMEFVAKQVAPYKKIRRVSFANSIPKNPAGKILRKDLINIALSEPKSKL